MGVVVHARTGNGGEAMCGQRSKTLMLTNVAEDVDCKRCRKHLAEHEVAEQVQPRPEPVAVGITEARVSNSARSRRVRVLRTLTWTTDSGQRMRKTVVRFKGTEAAFNIWRRSADYDAAVDTIETLYVSQRDPAHEDRWAAQGFAPIDTSSRVYANTTSPRAYSVAP